MCVLGSSVVREMWFAAECVLVFASGEDVRVVMMDNSIIRIVLGNNRGIVNGASSHDVAQYANACCVCVCVVNAACSYVCDSHRLCELDGMPKSSFGSCTMPCIQRT